MVIVTHESCDSVLVGTGKQKGLESLPENREWRRRCDVERQVVPDGGTRNRKRLWWIYLHRFLPKYDTAVIKFVATVPKYPHTAIKCSRRCKDNSPVDFKLSQSSLWCLKSQEQLLDASRERMCQQKPYACSKSGRANWNQRRINAAYPACNACEHNAFAIDRLEFRTDSELERPNA